MNFLVDQNLPSLLAEWIKAHGHDAQHVRALGLANASDRDISALARTQNAVIITRDVDFAQLAQTSPASSRVVWVRLGNTTNPDLLERWESAWPIIVTALEAGDRLVEVT